MRTYLLIEYRGARLAIPGIELLYRLSQIVDRQDGTAPPGAGTAGNPYTPRTYAHWRGIPQNTADVYYRIGTSLLRMNAGQYVYLLSNAHTGTYSTQNVTRINPVKRAQQIDTRMERRGRSRIPVTRSFGGAPGKAPAGYENWQAMSYPEYVRVLKADSFVQQQEQNTLAWMIRSALSWEEELVRDPEEALEVSSQRFDALALTMFGAETIRNRRQLPIQLMFLDLMQARAKFGRNADKGYNLERALSFERNDGSFNTTKGGKLPHMATGTVAQGADRGFEKYRTNAVNDKEISIIIHWLEQALPTIVYQADQGLAAVHERMVDDPRKFSEPDFRKAFASADDVGLMRMIENLFQARCSKLDMMLEKVA